MLEKQSKQSDQDLTHPDVVRMETPGMLVHVLTQICVLNRERERERGKRDMRQ